MSKKVIGDIGKDTENAGKRDAFHVPAIRVQCLETFNPGDHAELSDKTGTAIVTKGIGKGGIVDPFIKGTAKKGDMVYLLIDPSLVDVFYHAFDIEGIDTAKDSDEVRYLKQKIENLQAELEASSSDYDDGCGACYS